jgi:hypothetical protein
MTACAAPLPIDQLVDYWTNELDDAALAAVEEHLFGCASCTAAMERVQRVTGAFRSGLPPVITTAQLAELRTRGLAIEENAFAPDERREIRFPAHLDLLIHHLGGLSLHDAERVSLTVRSESSGIVIHEDPIAPFDRERGEILIACQKHFAAFPPDIVFDVRVHRPAQPPQVATYVLPHVFL